jgi:signal transduction histidine kinase
MTAPSKPNRFDIRKYFARGESLVATTGMAFIAILAFAVGGVVWISARTIDETSIARLEEQVRETSSLIGSQAEMRLNDGDLSGVRRLMLDSVASGVVDEAQISILGVGVIASSNMSQSMLTELPDKWASTPELPTHIAYDDLTNKTTVREPLIVDGRQGIVLEIIVDGSAQVLGSDSIRASSVGIMSVGLVLMLLVYRRFRNRLGALAAIGEALFAAQDGERRVDCLLVHEQLGTEAKVWNTLLRERDELEENRVEHEIIEASQSGVEDSIGLPAACNTLKQGVVLVGADLSVLYTNGAAAVFLRKSRDELAELPIDRLPHSELIVQAVQAVFEERGSTREVFESGDVNKIESEGAVLRFVVTRVEEDAIPRALIFIEDVTQQRLAEQSQNSFIAQAIHELRTPLTTIRLYAEEAVEAGSDDEQIRDKALNVINSETRRLERIVGDMLCVSEIEAGSLSVRLDTLRTEPLFAELKEDYQAQAKDKSIEIVFDLPPKYPTINADRDRLGQALHNLVGNAIKYTPSGGKVEVRVDFADNNAMTVAIIDDGIGIEESQHDRIFDRFCRADDRRIAHVTGSGIGLALARQIARLHGGDVTVESEIDQGSTFTLFIPGAEELAKAA